jgi:hypothetical protein
MATNYYRIRYTPPVQVKDQPHRTLDTLDSRDESADIPSEDCGDVSIVGETIEINTCRILPEEIGAETAQ